MKLQHRILTFLCIFLSAGKYAAAQNVLNYNDPHIRYSGRIDYKDDAAILSWSGSSVTVNFNGTGIAIKIKDERGDNFFNEILDGKVITVDHDTSKQVRTIAVHNLKQGRHNFQLFKRTEWSMGKTWVYQATIEGGQALPAPPFLHRKMEYFGDSITCGYADEDTSGKDRGTSPYENGYLSYAAITARHFNAEFHNTSKSGIGVMVSWFPLIMPEMYDRLDATDPESKWDFKKYRPQLVVINLFQNDSWIVKLSGNPQFKARFGSTPPTTEAIVDAYTSFVKSVRSRYPDAQIICALGSMDATRTGSPWPGYIEKAVAALQDPKIYTHFFPYKNTAGHPNVNEQQAMADDLIHYINEKIDW
jgi:hypothetical protein